MSGELSNEQLLGMLERMVLIREFEEQAATLMEANRIPGAVHLPRGQLELRADSVFPDPTVRILAYCEFGKISTIAAGTLRTMGFSGAVALDGGMRGWLDAGYPVEKVRGSDSL